MRGSLTVATTYQPTTRGKASTRQQWESQISDRSMVSYVIGSGMTGTETQQRTTINEQIDGQVWKQGKKKRRNKRNQD